MEALICSRLDVVSSTEEACSLVPCESDCALAEICDEATVSDGGAAADFADDLGEALDHVGERGAEGVAIGARRDADAKVA